MTFKIIMLVMSFSLIIEAKDIDFSSASLLKMAVKIILKIIFN